MSGALPEAPSAVAAALHHRGDCQEPRNKSDLLWIQLAAALSLLILAKTLTCGSALEKERKVAVKNLLKWFLSFRQLIDGSSRLDVPLMH